MPSQVVVFTAQAWEGLRYRLCSQTEPIQVPANCFLTLRPWTSCNVNVSVNACESQFLGRRKLIP